MATYLFILFGGILLTIVANLIFLGEALSVTVYTILTAVIIFCIDVVVAFILHKLPPKLYKADKFPYKTYAWERKVLEKLKIRKWKGVVPDMGQLCDFKKSKVESNEIEYIDKFLVETCYAEAIHSTMIFTAIVVFFMLKGVYRWSIGIPCFMINLILNLPPTLIQRYTRPKLMMMKKRQILIKERENKKLKEVAITEEK